MGDTCTTSGPFGVFPDCEGLGASVFLTDSVPPYSLVVQEDANVKVLSKKDRKNPHADFSI